VASRVIEEKNGLFRIEFTPTEVGSHLVEVSLAGEKLAAGPLVAKVYNSSLIRVTEVGSGVVGQPCQFRGATFLLRHSTGDGESQNLRIYTVTNRLGGILIRDFYQADCWSDENSDEKVTCPTPNVTILRHYSQPYLSQLYPI